MSLPTQQSNNGEYYEKIREIVFKKAGLVPVGRNEDGEMEFMGTDQEWDNAEIQLQDYLNNL